MASQPTPELFPPTETSVDCKLPPLGDCHMTFVLPVYRRRAEGDRRHMSLFKGGFAGIRWLSGLRRWPPSSSLSPRPSLSGEKHSVEFGLVPFGIPRSRVAPHCHAQACNFNLISGDSEASLGASGKTPGVGKNLGRPHLWFHLKR